MISYTKGDKLMLNNNKGQYTMEFIFAFFVFSLMILYIAIQMSGIMPGFYIRYRENTLLDKGNDLVESLMTTDTIRNGDDIKRYGFAAQPYVLNVTEMEGFHERCNASLEEYREIRDTLGFDNTSFFQLIIEEIDGDDLIRCDQINVATDIPNARVERYAVTEDKETVRIVMYLW